MHSRGHFGGFAPEEPSPKRRKFSDSDDELDHLVAPNSAVGSKGNEVRFIFSPVFSD